MLPPTKNKTEIFEVYNKSLRFPYRKQTNKNPTANLKYSINTLGSNLIS